MKHDWLGDQPTGLTKDRALNRVARGIAFCFGLFVAICLALAVLVALMVTD